MDVPILLDPVRIPELTVFAQQLKTLPTRQSALSPARANALLDLPMELQLSILDQLHFNDLQSLALSGVLVPLAPMAWWRRRFFVDFPWLWEIRPGAFSATDIDWTLAYAHVQRQSHDGRAEDNVSYEEKPGLYAGEGFWEEERGWQAIPKLLGDELGEHLARLRTRGETPDDTAIVASERQDGDREGKGKSPEPQSFCEIPGLVNRRRIWEICSTQIAPTYLAHEQVKQPNTGTEV